MAKRKRRYSAEEEGKRLLNQCSKHRDLKTALSLFDAHVAGTGPAFKTYEYNILLYLCSLVAITGEHGGVRRHAAPRRAAQQSHLHRARAPGVGAGRRAHGVPRGGGHGGAPRHRSYDPALLAFCRQGDLPRAEEVFQHMAAGGLAALPEQVAALLDVSVRAGSPGSVYKNIHRMRKVARGLPEDVIGSLRAWFESASARQGGGDGEGETRAEEAGESGSCEGETEVKGEGAEAGRKTWSWEEAERAMRVNGGGWHGPGWTMDSHNAGAAGGKGGEWQVQDVLVDEVGVCSGCGGQLATIDLDDEETERFARAHGPFSAVVDAANVGLYHQNLAQGGFNFWQLHSVAKAVAALAPAAPGSAMPSEASSDSPSASPRLPLLVVHHKRVKGGPAAQPFAQQCLAQYEQQHCLYTTPTGANDDWYWLYAAIEMQCLLALRMPPNFSFVIQESSEGGWHFPKAQTAGGQGTEGGENQGAGEGEVEMQGEAEGERQGMQGGEGEGGSGEGGGGVFDEWLCVQWKKQ
ncbi:hypothetical protein CLOP_g23283 [Closterium sp. NIES-67]|nr:hypothetical protein CLOP_g23283 [Closterium sp. NIES-67]